MGYKLAGLTGIRSLRKGLSSSRESPQHGGPLPGRDQPLDRRFKQPRGFDEPEKVALADQNIELRWAIATVIPIFEIHPKPGTPLPVVDVDGTAIWRVLMGQKDHESRWELEPTDDCGVVSELEESCNGFPEGLVLAQCKHLGDV
jgi:hypothetical protein